MQHQIVQKGLLRQNDLISGLFEAVSVSCLIAKLGQLFRETAAQNESGLFQLFLLLQNLEAEETECCVVGKDILPCHNNNHLGGIVVNIVNHCC